MRVIFGAGYTGSRVAEMAAQRGEVVLATVRSEAAAAALQGRGFAVTRGPVTDVARERVTEDTHAIVCFPPDGVTDQLLAPLLGRARAISYISTTGVYGDATGVIDDATPVPPRGRLSARQRTVLDAEALYRAEGATILRAPGIYGSDRGLHRRVTSGQHRIPGAGEGFLSRIHVTDLARLLLASDSVGGETFVVGDLEPARQRDVVQWICEQYGCPMPPFVPAAEVHESLRADRRVDPSRALSSLDVALTYPTFRTGMK